MQTFNRYLDLGELSKKKSFFLFGPRQTGKTFLLKRLFPTVKTYNLLLADQFSAISRRPSIVREELLASKASPDMPIIIDEIQKLPVLLDEVHNLIESHGFRFILTGSSARKLKRSGANLLGGRAWTRHLFPLVSHEIPDFDFKRAINFGTLPHVYQSHYPAEELKAYCGTYLREEIQAEGAVRRIENFSRFLQVASLVNAELLCFESVSRDAAVPVRTVRDYFSILEDTLIGTMLAPFRRTVHRKAVSAVKFYFFDVGVSNSLAGRTNIEPKTELFGKSFEHLIFTELKAWLDYTSDARPLTFWRDYNGHEIDFIIGDEIAIEVKGTDLVTEKHLKNLKMFSDDIKLKHQIVVSLDRSPRRLGDVVILPWRDFLSRLWSGEFVA
jgi:predicted AAA+ superfamily ATPase